MIDKLLDLAALPAAALPDSARQMARFSLFDWLVCGLAGVGEPVSAILRAQALEEGGAMRATLFGGGQVPARAAALVNGTVSHALDYDDTHFAHIGHLSVGILPAALAVGEETGAGAEAVADAFLIGAEAAIRIGLTLGPQHYNRGFHQTATAGAFGAAIAAGRLYGLTRPRMRAAIGLCATRASGLKSQFGTMGKPFNAGIAAANGVESAALARAGMTSADDGLMGPQGFVATHSNAPVLAGVWDALPPATFLFEDIKYKLHACCHGTHAMIEALMAHLRHSPQDASQVASLVLRTSPRWLSVCDIKAPRTGLEVKFSYAWLAAMVLTGKATSRDDSYTDALAVDPALAALARRVTVLGEPGLSEMQARITLTLADGQSRSLSHDLAARLPPATLETSLRTKARGLLGEGRAEQVWQAVSSLATLRARDLGQIIGGRE